MSCRPNWRISVWRSDGSLGAQRSILARLAQVGLATFIALAALMGVGGLLTPQRVLASAHNTDVVCPPPLSPILTLTVSSQVVRPGTEVVYTYTVDNPSTIYTLVGCVVEDRHLGAISPTYFSLSPGEIAALTATTTLTQNRTSTATVACSVRKVSFKAPFHPVSDLDLEKPSFPSMAGVHWPPGKGNNRVVSGEPVTTTVHVIEGLSLAGVHAEPPPVYYGDATALHYLVVNRDPDDGVVSGRVAVTDSLGRVLDEMPFDLGPGGVISQSTSTFTVPQDIVVTTTASGWDDVEGVLQVGDQVTLTLCPWDIYEPDDNPEDAHPIHPDEPAQRHDLSGDEDWVTLLVPQGGSSIYTFTARSAEPGGLPITLTLYQGNVALTQTYNAGSLEAQVVWMLSCSEAGGCDYYLQVESSANGCWTDYDLWVEESLVLTPLVDLVANARVVEPGTEVIYTYTVSNPSPIHTLIDVVVMDSRLGSIPPTYFSLPPGEAARLTATATLTQNRTSTATMIGSIKGYGAMVSGGPATTTVHVIEGLSLVGIYAEPPPVYYGDGTALHYSIVNKDEDDGIADGSVLIKDSLGRTLGDASFDLSPGDTIPQSTSSFPVPQDMVVTVTATGWDDVLGIVPVSDQAMLTLCPEDVYEPDDERGDAHEIGPGELPQLHDFSGDADWVRLQVPQGTQSIYTFVARPVEPGGVPITLTLYGELAPLISADNLGDPRSAAQIDRVLSCESAGGCEYYLRVESSASGCWTDYELWAEETLAPVPALALEASHEVVVSGMEVVYTYTVSNPSVVHTLVDIVVEDSHLGPIPPTHFSLPPGEQAKLTAVSTLGENRTSVVNATGGIEGYGGIVSGEPVTVTVAVIEGISLVGVYADPTPTRHGDATEVQYSIVNEDEDDGVADGNVVIEDSLGRMLGEESFGLGPGGTIPLSTTAFIVPWDVVITLTAMGWDDVLGIVPVSDQATLTLCPEDIYEPDDERRDAHDIGLGALPQIHDFSGNADWVRLQVPQGAPSAYSFIGRPLGPGGVPLTLTLYEGPAPLTSADNLGDPRSAAQIDWVLSCESVSGCEYYLQIESSSSGCWTDYELWVETTVAPIPALTLEASDEVVISGTQVVYTYTVSNPSAAHMLVDVVVEDSYLGSVPPTHFSLLPGEQTKLMAIVTLVGNRTSVASVTSGVEGYGGMVSGEPATVTVHALDGISLAGVNVDPEPARHGDVTAVQYSIVNVDKDDGVTAGTVLVTDSLSRALGEEGFALDPAATVSQSTLSFSVPRDVVITATATGWDDVQGVISVTDQVTLTLCPVDIYEPDDSLQEAHLIRPGEQQTHDHSGNEDWVRLQLPRGDPLLYIFTAQPEGPNGVPISLTLYHGLTFLAEADNASDPRSPAQISRNLWCTSAEGCVYFLRIESSASGCWTDYELSVEEIPIPTFAFKVSDEVVVPGTEVVYTYTVGNPSTVRTLVDVVVEDSHLGPIPPTHFSLLPGEQTELTAIVTLFENQTSIASVTSSVEGYDGTVSGEPAAVTVHVIDGISLAGVHVPVPPMRHGDTTEVQYSIVNEDGDDGVVDGAVLMEDSLGRTLDQVSFSLGPGASIPQSSPPFVVPQDMVVSLSATARDDVQGTLTVNDYVTLTLCPRDIYEPDDSIANARPIYPGQPQLHDFFDPNDTDWVEFRLDPGYQAFCIFTACPVAPGGLFISAALFSEGGPLVSRSNSHDPTSCVQIDRVLLCESTHECHYYLETASPDSGCWTDYELEVDNSPMAGRIWLPLIIRSP